MESHIVPFCIVTYLTKMLLRCFHVTEIQGKSCWHFFVLILTELVNSLWAPWANVINIVLATEGHVFSVLISVPLIQALNSLVVVKIIYV